MAAAIDTHAHLNDPRLLPHIEAVLARAREAGVEEIIVVGWNVASSETAIHLTETYPDLWAAVGIHPHHAQEEATPEGFQRLRELAARPRVVAIGETGLDFYRDLSPRPAQREALHRHLELASELGLPVVLHCREAQDELLEAVARYQRLGLIWHCFDGTAEHVRRAVGLGMFTGFGGMITYKQAEALREALAVTPLDRLLLETDAPYLSPKPRRSQDNEPANVMVVAARAAEVRGEDREELIAATAANARRVFGLEETGG